MQVTLKSVESVPFRAGARIAAQSLDSVRGYLALAHRLDVIADDLETCRDHTLSLTLERYWDDYSL
jgi:hypothetical protein